MKALRSIILITLAYYASSLHAVESTSLPIDTPLGTKDHTWVQSSDNQLLVNIPSSTLSDVKDQMYETRSHLTTRKSKLVRTVEDKEFSLKDGLITLILPGGFLYAAAIKQDHINAKNELSEIINRLNEINHDILNLVMHEQQPHGILVARN